MAPARSSALPSAPCRPWLDSSVPAPDLKDERQLRPIRSALPTHVPEQRSFLLNKWPAVFKSLSAAESSAAGCSRLPAMFQNSPKK